MLRPNDPLRPNPTLEGARAATHMASDRIISPNYEGNGLAEYTQRHRELWPQLVSGRDAETLVPDQLPSWLVLWGRLGAELYQCFHLGDDHIRADMIGLARDQGGWRGTLIADRLERWQRRKAC